MDEEDYSWVRRTRFSQSIVRSSSSREQYGALIKQFGDEMKLNGFGTGRSLPRQNLQAVAKGSVHSNSARLAIPRPKSGVAGSEGTLKHTSSDGQLNRERPSDRSLKESSAKQDRKGVGLSLDIPQLHVVRPPTDESPGALDFSFHTDKQSQRLQRVCSSPAPFYLPDAAPPADDSRGPSASMEAIGEAATKRFSSPQRQRKPTSPRSPDDSPPLGFASLRTPSRLKINRRTSSWPKRNLDDDGSAKVAALEILERWTVDRSQLLIGHRFASGAYSRLFHGIYKEQPVAVKFVRQPDEGEDEELSARLEKQFTAEVTILARLQHRNVIKVTT
ncbi:hypothetical protein HU200_018900 [Digitaria exilis]|uniref:Protein kinase domain-containing protein n=1 Tax=Digitaria exilis TaxID=1010633 RepID=A0A835KDQ9_9POAL|nr:hypothetical protein HU200_018900 [Digitaria exilis]